MKFIDEQAFRRMVTDGLSIAIGGFGLDRKPLGLVRWLARAPAGGHSIQVFAGGLDVEMLLASGKIARLGFSHVGLDHLGLAPRFRAARESAAFVAEEWSESSMLAALRASADRVPFAAVALDPATQLRDVNPRIRTMVSPYDGAPATIVQAIGIDLALLHVEAAHPDGWGLGAGDAYVDAILARAAKRVVVSCERLAADAELTSRANDVQLLDSWVDHIVVDPLGARPGSCQPLYPIDFEAVLPLSTLADAGTRS